MNVEQCNTSNNLQIKQHTLQESEEKGPWRKGSELLLIGIIINRLQEKLARSVELVVI